MDAWVWILIAAVLLLIVAAFLVSRRSKTRRLKEGFGPEYDRTVSERESRRRAEGELQERAKRREQLDIRPLPEGDRRRYGQEWERIQKDFVDEPHKALESAQYLVDELMGKRGYPMSDFDQRAADISVDHPRVVENYRAAHGLTEVRQNREITTEELRQGMVHYRALFVELLDSSPSNTK
ncbi:MAG: hypothetical protein ACRDJL_12710 [Actinomycetota bacterium]